MTFLRHRPARLAIELLAVLAGLAALYAGLLALVADDPAAWPEPVALGGVAMVIAGAAALAAELVLGAAQLLRRLRRGPNFVPSTDHCGRFRPLWSP